MNNAFMIDGTLAEDSSPDVSPLRNKRMQDLTDIIEALQHIAGSSYWKVLQQYIFDVDVAKARKSLTKETDTTELFRLQGEIRALERYALEAMLDKYRNELETIRKQINAT
jgi:hypothetical protein